jgi:hypothetical protein
MLREAAARGGGRVAPALFAEWWLEERAAEGVARFVAAR